LTGKILYRTGLYFIDLFQDHVVVRYDKAATAEPDNGLAQRELSVKYSGSTETSVYPSALTAKILYSIVLRQDRLSMAPFAT
jgi:hypothetical protein